MRGFFAVAVLLNLGRITTVRQAIADVEFQINELEAAGP